jgi:hypothetical protein
MDQTGIYQTFAAYDPRHSNMAPTEGENEHFLGDFLFLSFIGGFLI